MKHLLYIFVILLLQTSYTYSQSQDIPIVKEKPKRGLYESFEEFKFNTPGIQDTFYIQLKERTQQNWEGTFAPTPYYVATDKKAKRIWGFSDGKDCYIYFLREYFKVQLDTSNIGFYAYAKINEEVDGIITTSTGVIGGSIYNAIANDITRKKKIYYYLDPLNGQIKETSDAVSANANKLQYTTLTIYRRNKKEMKEPLSISINDSLQFSLIPNSLKEFKIPVTRDTIDLYYGAALKQSLQLVFIKTDPQYVEISFPKKEGKPSATTVPEQEGVYYARQVQYFEDKRNQQ